MEEKLFKYVKKHTMLIAFIIIAGFILLGIGEFLLYRKIMIVNQMVSEGLMQIKEATTY